jgi:HAMP domain-containing protein
MKPVALALLVAAVAAYFTWRSSEREIAERVE